MILFKYRVGENDMLEIKSTNKKGIVDARALACYIKKFYSDNFHGAEISPIKLQKSLYFCFAYWGGFVRRGRNNKSEISTNNYSEILFDNKIEAWVYGPVVPDVYHEKNLDKYEKQFCFVDRTMEEYIKGILTDVLAANDFKLVEVSHEDKCWRKHFNKKSIFHNDVISPEEIISEYAKI